MSNRPTIGIHYWAWHCIFHRHDPQDDCTCPGWQGAFNGVGTRSFSWPRSQFPDGRCYNSRNPDVATKHAELFHELNIDFVVFDETNWTKEYDPDHPRSSFAGALAAIQGFQAYSPKPTKCAFMLGITCWACSCWLNHPLVENLPCEDQEADRDEIFTFNDHVKKHIDAIASLARSNPSAFQQLDGKPLLLFYIHKGNDVHMLDGPKGSRSQAFNGHGNILPTEADFDCLVVDGSGEVRPLRDVFTVRYAVVAHQGYDYSSYSPEAWPFTCDTINSRFREVGYAAIKFDDEPGGGRDISWFNKSIDTCKGKPFILIRGWNEFPIGTHPYGWDLEPHSNDGSDDPYLIFEGMKMKLNRNVIENQNSGKVLDVQGFSTHNGGNIQQWDYQETANQQWALLSVEDGFYKIVSVGSNKVLDVTEASDEDGANVQQWTYGGNPNQQWRLEGIGGEWYKIVNRNSGKVLDVRGQSTDNGANIQQWSYNGTANQHWKINEVGLG